MKPNLWRQTLKHSITHVMVWLLGLLPFVSLVLGAVNNTLGANPAEYLIRATGDWTLRWLCLTLCITPLRQWSGVNELALFRRKLGLLTYGYAMLHLLCYAGFDRYFEWPDIYADVVKRPFIMIGFLCFVLLTPLALTSFNRAIRWLGGQRWQRLHRLVYIIAPLAILHFWWMRAAKHNFFEVGCYGFLILILLLYRLVKSVHRINRT
jgi:sulfoxide reductase heme-binding subunit YedZ